MSGARSGPELAALGRALVASGLHPRALAAWRGTATLARLPARFAAQPGRNASRAALALELLVAGQSIPYAEAAPVLGDAVPALLELGVLARDHELLRPRRAIVPLGSPGQPGRSALAVCDRWDAPGHRDATSWPDDSSHHLCGALTGIRGHRWLDLGTGSGVAPLCCPEVATTIVGAEVVVATAQSAALGAALSDRPRYHVVVSDLDDAIAGRWDVVTCNAPIPADGAPLATSASRWRHAEATFLDRLCQRLPSRVSPAGVAVLHAQFDALERALADLGGEAVSVVYTPPQRAAFAVTWWQPHLPTRRITVRRVLTPERPHIDGSDREDAANKRLPPLPEPGAS